MANLQGNDEEGVSLFPMFNILACTLGVMVFVLATVATVSLGADKAVEYVSDEVPVEVGGPLQGRVPTWMTWDGSELALLPGGESVTFETDLAQVSYDDLPDHVFDRIVGTDSGRAISGVSLAENRYVVLLVRPSGFRTLPKISSYIELLGIAVVPEPIDQDLRRIQVR